MARDTMVYWSRQSVPPSRDDLRTVLDDYLGTTATDVVWGGGRFVVTLHGHLTFPYQRIGPATHAQRAAWPVIAKNDNGTPRSRWFEVFVAQEYINVITRDMDPYTQAVADAYAMLCARAWRGRLVE